MTYKTCNNYSSGECTNTEQGNFCPQTRKNLCLGEIGTFAVLKSRNCITTEKKVNKYAERMKQLGMRSK
jgi:hypothetical protein